MKTNTLASLIVILIITLGCSTSAFPPPQPTAAPAATSAPVVAKLLSQSVTLTSTPLSEESQTPIYKITAQVPALTGSDDPRVQAFNSELKALVQKEIDAFKQGASQTTPGLPVTGHTYFDVRYELVGQKGDFWSIKFNIEGYMDGAAHPYHYSIPFNYDLNHGKDIVLDDLFLPNSNYLQAVSQYCAAELSKRNIGFDGFQQGADPTPVNYRVWNVSQDGLVVTFDEYQVAPYVAGPQTVTVPFGELTSLLNPGGPARPFLP